MPGGIPDIGDMWQARFQASLFLAEHACETHSPLLHFKFRIEESPSFKFPGLLNASGSLPAHLRRSCGFSGRHLRLSLDTDADNFLPSIISATTTPVPSDRLIPQGPCPEAI